MHCGQAKKKASGWFVIFMSKIPITKIEKKKKGSNSWGEGVYTFLKDEKSMYFNANYN